MILCVLGTILGTACRDAVTINVPGQPLPADTRVVLSDASWSHVFLTGDSGYAVVSVRGRHESSASVGVSVALSVKAPDGTVLKLNSEDVVGSTPYGGSVAFFAWPVNSPGEYAATASSPRSEDDLHFVINALDGDKFVIYDLQPNSRVNRGWIALSPDRRFVSVYTGGSRELPNARTWGGSGAYIQSGDNVSLNYPLEARLLFSIGQMYGGGLFYTERSFFFQDALVTSEQLVVRWNDPNNDSCCIDWTHKRRAVASH